ncbi:MAG: MotA/TolQ/ExbB proton channel family protein [Candidatus Kapabacteria bacterium]|nr:MotA/TolQ/ExbB proton channel family protein [Candidatus Kapabacteria bacterium]
MKNMFNVLVIILSFVVAFLFYYLILGNAANFNDIDKHDPKTVLGTIYTGGPLVGILIGLLILSITFVFERVLSISKARGKGNPDAYIKNLTELLAKGNMDEALTLCENQRGSLANVMRSAIARYKDVENDSDVSAEKKIGEVQRAIDEAMNLETPLLEKNLVILSTVASISTMVGLLGTTIGMIRAFKALAAAGGAVSATQLSIGISEALWNTAGGLTAAIISIVAYNVFTTKVDNFVYMIDEAILSVTQIFTIRVKK